MGSKTVEFTCPICKEKRMGIKKNIYTPLSLPCKSCSIAKAKSQFSVGRKGVKLHE